jgi:hypothetical protein
MGSTRVEIEFFCVVETIAEPWCAKARLENIHEFGKNTNDGNKRSELHTDQPRKFAIDSSEFSIDFSESAIHVRAQVGYRAIKPIVRLLILLG